MIFVVTSRLIFISFRQLIKSKKCYKIVGPAVFLGRVSLTTLVLQAGLDSGFTFCDRVACSKGSSNSYDPVPILNLLGYMLNCFL